MRPNTYANTANVPARMAVRPVARPSRPSLRFTAFEVPVTTNVTNSTYSGGGKTSRMYLNTGSWVDLPAASTQLPQRKNTLPSATPQVTGPTDLHRPTRPRDAPRTIARAPPRHPTHPAA